MLAYYMGSTSLETNCLKPVLRCAPRLRCPVVERSSVWTLLRSVNDKYQNKRPVFTDSAHASVWTFVSATLHAGWSSSFTRYPYCDAMLRMYCTMCSDIYTGCPRRNVPDFGRVFLMLKYTDITQSTYVQSWTVTEIMAREKCGLLAGPHTVPVSWQSYPFPSSSVVSYDDISAYAINRTARVLPSGCYVTAGHSHV